MSADKMSRDRGCEHPGPIHLSAGAPIHRSRRRPSGWGRKRVPPRTTPARTASRVSAAACDRPCQGHPGVTQVEEWLCEQIERGAGPDHVDLDVVMPGPISGPGAGPTRRVFALHVASAAWPRSISHPFRTPLRGPHPTFAGRQGRPRSSPVGSGQPAGRAADLGFRAARSGSGWRRGWDLNPR